MARELDAIIKELDAGYNPSRALINQRLAALPGQADAEVAGLQATQKVAFDDILGGARDRGLGFSGIPIQEQARYTSTNFLPAVARVRQSQNDSRTSLVGALNEANADQRNRAMGIRQTELDRDEAARQFNEKLAAEKEAQARAERAAARSAGGSFGSLLGGGGGPAAAGPQRVAPKTNTVQQDAYNEVRTRLSSHNDAQLRSDFAATARSAGFGNLRDRAKVQFYMQLRPDLFRSAPSSSVLGNRVSF